MSTRSFGPVMRLVVMVWLGAAALFLGVATNAWAHPGGGGGGGGGGGHASYAGHGSYGGSAYHGSYGSSGAHYSSGYAGYHASYSPGRSGAPYVGAGRGAWGSEWGRGESWSHHAGPWYGWNYYPWGNSFYYHQGWWPGWGLSFGFYGDYYPWAWGPFYGGYYAAYGDYLYGYPGDSGYGYVDSPTGLGYMAGYRGAAAADSTVQTAQPVPELPQPPQGAATEGNNRRSAEALQYYSEAREEFTKGGYREAQRLASHAAVEEPRNAKVYEMISLALFASGEYVDAARSAHLALVMAPPSDWGNLYSYYGDVDKYTAQLRQLEKTVHDEPKGAAGRFLLGYHYLMSGAKDRAKEEFEAAVKLTPGDKLAAHILKQLEAGQPVTPPAMPSQTSEPTPPTPGPGSATNESKQAQSL